jgi:hypothetical protein
MSIVSTNFGQAPGELPPWQLPGRDPRHGLISPQMLPGDQATFSCSSTVWISDIP